MMVFIRSKLSRRSKPNRHLNIIVRPTIWLRNIHDLDTSHLFLNNALRIRKLWLSGALFDYVRFKFDVTLTQVSDVE